MKTELSQQPITIANSSGIPLQIATAHAVRQSDKWAVLVEEHPWQSDLNETKGFIDIVAVGKPTRQQAGVHWREHIIERECMVMVIECKRVKQTAWVFLIPEADAPNTENLANVWYSQRTELGWIMYGWDMWKAAPASYQSQYCAIPGHEQGRRNLLERTASELIDSVEALAAQEKQIQERNKTKNFNRVYIPVVVTTAELVVSCCDPSSISLADGSLPDNACFLPVPCVRFRKSLSIRHQLSAVSSVEELHDESECTIFVVNASGLPAFLNDFKLPR